MSLRRVSLRAQAEQVHGRWLHELYTIFGGRVHHGLQGTHSGGANSRVPGLGRKSRRAFKAGRAVNIQDLLGRSTTNLVENVTLWLP